MAVHLDSIRCMAGEFFCALVSETGTVTHRPPRKTREQLRPLFFVSFVDIVGPALAGAVESAVAGVVGGGVAGVVVALVATAARRVM